MKKLVFLGSGLSISILKEAAEEMGYEVAGIIDNDYYGNTTNFCDIPLINGQSCFDDPAVAAYYRENFVFFFAINWLPMKDAISVRNKAKRHDIIALIKEHNLECINIISSMTTISKSATLGKGIFIGQIVSLEAHCIINDFSNIWGHQVIGHHAQIGENCQIQRHAELYGSAKIGDNVYLGSHVGVVQDAVIGDNVWVQPGIIVCRNAENNEIIGSTKKSLRRTVPYYGTSP